MPHQTEFDWRALEGRARAEAAGELAREAGLSDLQAALVEHVMAGGRASGVRDERPVSVLASSKRELARELGCSAAGIAAAVDRLVALGILETEQRGQRGTLYSVDWAAVFALGRSTSAPPDSAMGSSHQPPPTTTNHHRPPTTHHHPPPTTTNHPEVSPTEEPHGAPRTPACTDAHTPARVASDARPSLSLSLYSSSTSTSERDKERGELASPEDARRTATPNPAMVDGPSATPSVDSVASCSEETPARVVDWSRAIALYERACPAVAGQVLLVRSELGGLVFELAGLAVAINQETLLLEACAIVRRRRPENSVSYLRAVMANLAWERLHGAEPATPHEKASARVWLKEELATIRSGIPPPAELRRLAASLTTHH